MKTTDTVTLRVIETSDVHGLMLNYDYFAGKQVQNRGFALTAATINQAKAEQPLHLLIDNGDLIQGSAFADWAAANPNNWQTHPIIAALNHLNYDVANLGNHEFNYGLDYLYKTYKDAKFAVLSSNLEINQQQAPELKQLVRSAVVIERQVHLNDNAVDLRIGVIGVLPPQIETWDGHHLRNKASATAMVDAVQTQVKKLQAQGVDLILLAAHTGMPKAVGNPNDEEQATWLLAGIDGIDAIVFGHQHEVFPGTHIYDSLPGIDSKDGAIRGIPAVQPGVFGSHVGILDLTLAYREGNWHILGWRSEARAVADQQPDAAISEMIRPTHEQTLKFMQQPVGFTAVPLTYHTARIAPSHAVQFVQEAQIWYAKRLMAQNSLELDAPLLSAAAPFDAAYTANEEATVIPAGPLNRGHFGDLYRYPNTLDIVKLSGAQLKDWLEAVGSGFQAPVDAKECWSAIDEDFAHYNFDAFLAAENGLKYTFDASKPEGSRLVALSYQGQPIDDQQMFYIATNNYRANGGGDFPHLDGQTVVLRGPDLMPDILMSYVESLAEKRYESALRQNWQVIGCGGRI